MQTCTQYCGLENCSEKFYCVLRTMRTTIGYRNIIDRAAQPRFFFKKTSNQIISITKKTATKLIGNEHVKKYLTIEPRHSSTSDPKLRALSNILQSNNNRTIPTNKRTTRFSEPKPSSPSVPSYTNKSCHSNNTLSHGWQVSRASREGPKLCGRLHCWL